MAVLCSPKKVTTSCYVEKRKIGSHHFMRKRDPSDNRPENQPVKVMTYKESIPISLHVPAVGFLPTPYKAGAAKLLLPYASLSYTQRWRAHSYVCSLLSKNSLAPPHDENRKDASAVHMSRSSCGLSIRKLRPVDNVQKSRTGMSTVRVFAVRAYNPLVTILSLPLYTPSHKIPKTKVLEAPIDGCFLPSCLTVIDVMAVSY